MPRFLHKLVQHIKTSQEVRSLKLPRAISPRSRSTRRVINKALPPPSFLPHGRKQSILLDDVNPILHNDAFVQHKTDGPITPSAAGRGKHTNTSREIREMTALECKWWSNPYREGIHTRRLPQKPEYHTYRLQVRMIASPPRLCMVTQKHLPSDFMIRLAVLRVVGPRVSQVASALLPDGVEHPRFRRQNSGRGHYMTCHNIFVNEMTLRSSHRRIPVANVHVHAMLAAQIGYQLRLRVLQELELLAESLRCTPQGSLENTVIRRLTRAEWVEVKTSGRIAQPGAVAVLVVPPINKSKPSDPTTNNHDAQATSPLPPLSILHGVRTSNDGLLPNSFSSLPQVPLYNGLALVQTRPMRSKLYQALQKALLVERRARWRQGTCREPLRTPKGTDGHQLIRDKASHAYLLRSDENTVKRADSVPLAIALWRIRMWEGQGWESDLGNYGGWESKPRIGNAHSPNDLR